MEMYFEKGESKKDCELKIMQKYHNRPFQIMQIKPCKLGGFFGLFGKDGIEVGFIFLATPSKAPYDLHSGRPPDSRGGPHDITDPQALEEAKKRVLALAGKTQDQVLAAKEADKKQQQILEKLAEMEESLKSGLAKGEDEHPSFASARRLLRLNEFSQKYIDRMLERMRKELSMETLDNFDEVQGRLLEWIGDSVSIYSEPERKGRSRRGRVMILIGPTGVGKTTTIAKLAATYTRQKKPPSIRLITIDQFRIGAEAQLEAFGDIMKIPVLCAKTKEDLESELATYQDSADIFLVDTFGTSPKDAHKLAEMKELLNVCPKYSEIHLAFSANTKADDIEEILRQFEPFNYLSVLLTKWDETNHFGNVISALAEKGKSLSFITDGQNVPQDIKKAAVLKFLLHLEDFKVDRQRMEERFSAGGEDQVKWG